MAKRMRRLEHPEGLSTQLSFASRDLNLGKDLGVLSARIKAKLKRFPRLNPGCRHRSRWTRGEKSFRSAVFRDINLACRTVSGIPSYRRSTGSVAYYRIRRCRDHCGGCRGTSCWRIWLGIFRRSACSEEKQRQKNSNRRTESSHKYPLLMVFLEQSAFVKSRRQTDLQTGNQCNTHGRHTHAAEPRRVLNALGYVEKSLFTPP